VSIAKVINSAGRWDRVHTLKWLPSAILCVPRSQEARYRERHPDQEYLVHPDEIKGLLPKRNWLREQLADTFELGDDVIRMQSCMIGPKEKAVFAEGDFADALIDRLADEARELGVHLFSFSSFAHPTMYDPLKPFRLTGLVYGQAVGILGGGGLYWNTKIKIAGDYWMSLLNAYHHRIALVDNRWATITVDMFKGKGGLTNVRTTGAEEADTKLLRATFGDDVIRQRKSGPVVTYKGYSHTQPAPEWMRTVTLPY
jgi:hypothetical protein